MKDEDKQRLAGQLVQLDEAYPGGLLEYVHNARRLLQDSREGALSQQGHMIHAVCHSVMFAPNQRNGLDADMVLAWRDRPRSDR